LGSLLKDIKSERPKITEKDNLRLLFVTKWFLEFFLAALAKDSKDSVGTGWGWGFELVTEVVDRGWIVWILRRMRGAVEEKVGRVL
jgi:replication fork protection complex subunit TIMELESS/Tof1/Swi1